MPIVEEPSRNWQGQVFMWVTRDYANSGALRGIVGFRCHNITPVALRVHCTYGPQRTVLDWWTPLDRPDAVIAQGEDVSATFSSHVPAGLSDSFSIGVGEA